MEMETPSGTKKPAIRHAESRRTSTCRFADRVARKSVDHYQQHVPASFRESQQTCLATVVAHEAQSDRLTVLSMGVGTKFLSEAVLKDEENTGNEGEPYGLRVRDLHAEVLARRAFRRYLTEAMLQYCDDGVSSSTATINRLSNTLLERAPSSTKFHLKHGVTLHFYCSSSPCGNSVIKKFGTMKKEVFREDLSYHCWPSEAHESMVGHSIPLGQFALLVKKDNSAAGVGDDDDDDDKHSNRKKRKMSKKQATWKVNSETDWCPPGTTTVWSGKGSLHTCSDKLARWNFLGFQGSLLSTLLVQPLYIQSITVGRKYSALTCRRAICCRLASGTGSEKVVVDGPFRLQHPATMGTAVLLDETGVIDMSSDRAEGQDVRFYSSLSWASWWTETEAKHVVECIDGETGLLAIPSGESATASDTNKTQASNTGGEKSGISTNALVESFLILQRRLGQSKTYADNACSETTTCPTSLRELHLLKATFSGPYENAKNHLLLNHPVVRDWRRRGEMQLFT